MPTSRPTRAVLLTALTALTLGLVEVTDAEAVASTAAPLSPVTSPRVEVMVAVITQDEIVPAGSARKHIKLVTARSTNGSQWTGHKVLPLSFSAGYQFRPDAAGTVRYGINPSLNLLGNGATTLQFGRPDNWFAISTDGGRSFVQAPGPTSTTRSPATRTTAHPATETTPSPTPTR